jgi:alkylmercury lyase
LLHLGTDKAEKVLTSYAEVDDQGRVAGFFGLSLVPTPHKLMVKGKVLYTWCAMDAIILPQLLLLETLIESVDPLNGQRIQLSVNEDFLDWTDPVPVFISWTKKNASFDIRQRFCPQSHLFASQEIAEKWLVKNADISISNVEGAFTFARGGRACC